MRWVQSWLAFSSPLPIYVRGTGRNSGLMSGIAFSKLCIFIIYFFASGLGFVGRNLVSYLVDNDLCSKVGKALHVMIILILYIDVLIASSRPLYMWAK